MSGNNSAVNISVNNGSPIKHHGTNNGLHYFGSRHSSSAKQSKTRGSDLYKKMKLKYEQQEPQVKEDDINNLAYTDDYAGQKSKERLQKQFTLYKKYNNIVQLQDKSKMELHMWKKEVENEEIQRREVRHLPIRPVEKQLSCWEII